jgi:hypothetical protein
MDARCKDLCNALGKCVVERNFTAAQPLFAPWLRATLSPATLQRMVDAQNEELEHPPCAWSLGEGILTVADLRTPDPYGPPSQPIAREITQENFRGWLRIQFVPDPEVHDEQNVCFDLWLVAVQVGDAVLAGYVEATEPT